MLRKSLASMPELKEDQPLCREELVRGLRALSTEQSDQVDAPSSSGSSPVPLKRENSGSFKRANSGFFGGSGDSGVWPGAQSQVAGAMSYIQPSTIACIVVWYVTGALTNSTSKQTLAQCAGDNKPFLTLTLMQHLCAAACGTFAIRVLHIKKYKSVPADAFTLRFYQLLVVYTAGFCLTNGSFGKVNASFVDTIKAAEPIATVLLTLIFLPEEKITPLIFLSLLPIVAGVGISSLSDTSFNLLGFAMAMGSNLCFSARSITAKMLRSSLGKQMDNANLFVHVNAYGAMALMPVAMYVEGPVLFTMLLAGGKPAALFVANGVFYYLNNQMNFLVLEKIDAVTHGLINCGRRVANILFAIVWFGTSVTLYNGIGISCALSGAYLYMKAKVRVSKQHAAMAASPVPGWQGGGPYATFDKRA
jgi:solute carrier family 35 protein E1